MKKKCYYAHCIGIYNTLQEKRDIETLTGLGFEVVNPNSKECSEGYKLEGMKYFERFPKECDLVAFRSLPDGRIPAGVGKEIRGFQNENKSVIELPSCLVKRIISVEETREYLCEIGKR